MSLPFISRRRFNPYRLPNWALRYDIGDLASLDYNGSNQIQLFGDKSGNSATNCLVLNGVNSNYAYTADSAAVSITGDITALALIRAYTPASVTVITAKYSGTGNQRSFLFDLTSAKKLIFNTSPDGISTSVATSSLAIPFSDFTFGWVGATRKASDGTVKFYTAPFTGSFLPPPFPSVWTQLGSTQANTAGNIFDSTSILEFGSAESGVSGSNWNGCIGSVSLLNGYDGAGTVVCAPNFSLASKLATSFPESSSNAATVTINTSGDYGARICGERDGFQFTAGKRLVLSNVGGFWQAQADGSNDVSASGSFALAQPCSVYMVIVPTTWTANDVVCDGRSSDTMELFQDTTTPRMSMYAGGTVGPVSPALGLRCVVGMVFNGANSWISVNGGPRVIGNAGTATPNGLTLGANAAGSSPANVAYNEVGVRSVADDETTFYRIMRALMRKYPVG